MKQVLREKMRFRASSNIFSGGIWVRGKRKDAEVNTFCDSRNTPGRLKQKRGAANAGFRRSFVTQCFNRIERGSFPRRIEPKENSNCGAEHEGDDDGAER